MNKFLKLLTAVYNIVTRKIILDPINLKYSLKKYIKLALFTEMYIFYLAKSIFENFYKSFCRFTSKNILKLKKIKH